MTAPAPPALTDASVGIRLLRPDDIPSCLAVVSQCWGKSVAQVAEPEFREAFAGGAYKPVFYVAEANSRVIGTSFYKTSWLTYGLFEMGWLGVHPDFRRRGVGSALVERRLRDLSLIASAAMIVTPIPGFFKRWGFQPVCSVPRELPVRGREADDTLMMLLFESLEAAP